MLSKFSQDPKYMMFPILLKEILQFLGAATIAIHNNTAPGGFSRSELQWSKCTGAC